MSIGKRHIIARCIKDKNLSLPCLKDEMPHPFVCFLTKSKSISTYLVHTHFSKISIYSSSHATPMLPAF